MAAEYRAPKAVREEAEKNVGELSSRIASPLSIEDVVEIRTSWVGEAGIAWANKITADITSRADLLTKGEPMPDITAADVPAMDMESVIAKVGAIDVLVDELMDCLGICDDAKMLDETPGEPSPTRNAEEDLMMEPRKTMIRSAETITMHAEVRSIPTDDGSLKIGGHAVKFNEEATGLNFREMIAPGAFTRSLQSDEPIFLLVNHNMDELPLASTRSGTMRLLQDEVGLRMEASLDPLNPRAAELISALTRGDVNKMSFTFTVNPGGETRVNGLRTITDCRLWEASIVTLPAYDGTEAGMRSAQEAETEALELRRKGLQLKARLISINK